MKFSWKNIENWRSWKMRFLPVFLSRPFWFFFFKIFFLLHLNEKTKGFHMRYHLFLQYGWFLQNLGKYFIRTNMHTTVALLINSCNLWNEIWNSMSDPMGEQFNLFRQFQVFYEWTWFVNTQWSEFFHSKLLKYDSIITK